MFLTLAGLQDLGSLAPPGTKCNQGWAWWGERGLEWPMRPTGLATSQQVLVLPEGFPFAYKHTHLNVTLMRTGLISN